MLTDQEGGLVRRLPGAPELSEKQIGESPDALALAAQAGQSAGEELAGVGINVNLAPVLDVFRQPGDFIDEFQRSYGMDPRLVGQLAVPSSRRCSAPGWRRPRSTFPASDPRKAARIQMNGQCPSVCRCASCGPSTRLPTGKPSQRACGW